MPPKKKRLKFSPLEFSPLLGDLSPLNEFHPLSSPTRRDVVRRVIYHHGEKQKPLDDSVDLVSKELTNIHSCHKSQYRLKCDVKNLYQKAK